MAPLFVSLPPAYVIQRGIFFFLYIYIFHNCSPCRFCFPKFTFFLSFFFHFLFCIRFGDRCCCTLFSETLDSRRFTAPLHLIPAPIFPLSFFIEFDQLFLFYLKRFFVPQRRYNKEMKHTPDVTRSRNWHWHYSNLCRSHARSLSLTTEASSL